MAKGCPPQPKCSRGEGHSRAVGFSQRLAVPCCWEHDPSPCCKPHSLSRASQAPAFLAKPASSSQLRNVGVMLQGALPLQLMPAHSSCPARVEWEEESRAGGAALQGHPSPRQRHSACAARGQGHIKGGFTEARGVFPQSVFACAQVRAFPALERCSVLSSCLLWPQPRGLSPGQSSPKQCPVCAVGRGIHGPAVTGKRALGCFHPRAGHRRLSKHIPPHPDTCRAAGNAHTAGCALWGPQAEPQHSDI